MDNFNGLPYDKMSGSEEFAEMRFIPILFLTFLLLACSGGIGGAPGGGGAGPIGDTTVGGGSGGAAQPLDAGFSGPAKDVHGYNYVLREAKASVICQESNGDSRIRLSGQVFNDRTQMGIAGFLRITDQNAQRFQVTRSANEPAAGSFSTVMKVRPPFDLFFAMLVTHEEPAQLDVLLPVRGTLVQVIIAELPAPLSFENTDTDQPCIEAAGEGPTYQSVGDQPAPVSLD
ncbi:MAG TPA: hypothetical protein VFW62_09045 [bacterium]|nr:hypothetical protein [bacterium]